MSTKSVLEQIKELDKQKSKLLESAKSDALKSAQSAVDELSALGFNYSIVEKGAKSGRSGTRTVKDAPCDYCGFKTSPVHDKRAHRSQTDKKPFTDAELTDKGYTKV